ncbi:MAG: DM13 domain-containing protein [Actinomycetota bacterium]
MAEPTQLRSQPWWQDVTTVEGTGTATASPFTVVPNAVQWRIKGTCQSGRLVVVAAGHRRPIVDAPCTGEVTGFGTTSGPVALQVTADGPWRLAVAQQIDSPLVEPSLPAMAAPGAVVVGRGSFYGIDKTGVGTVTIFRQADGKYSLRLDDFFVSPTADLELRLSTLEAPKTSQEYLNNGSSELVVMMDVTAGSLNYPVPEGIDPTKYKSVVIWCAPILSAYAAASLEGVR